MSTKIAKSVIKHTLGSVSSSSVSDLPPQQNTQIPEVLITPGGKIKKNKWKIPPNLTQQEAKILTRVKKRAHLLDYGFNACCCCCKIRLDPIIGNLFYFVFIFFDFFP